MQNFEFSLKNKFSFHEFLIKENFTDTVLVCENSMIKSHKLLLASSSQYFYELFTMLGDSGSTVVLKDIKLNQLMKILEIIYCGKVTIRENELDDFRGAIEYFCMNINISNESNFVNDHNNSIPEFMSQETTVGNLTMDSFRLNDSDDSDTGSDDTLTGIRKSTHEPKLKKIKLTDSFEIFSLSPIKPIANSTEFRNTQQTESERKKRNYFEFSEMQKKKVEFETLVNRNSVGHRTEFKPQRLHHN